MLSGLRSSRPDGVGTACGCSRRHDRRSARREADAWGAPRGRPLIWHAAHSHISNTDLRIHAHRSYNTKLNTIQLFETYTTKQNKS